MKTLVSMLAAASLGISGMAMAQAAAPAATTAPAKAAAPAMKKAAKSAKAATPRGPAKPRTALSIDCSKQADAKGLHGKARESFRDKCKKGGK